MAIEYNLDGVAGSYSLLELARRGVVPTDGSPDALECTYDDNGDLATITWRGET
jgi:hypothetical protein